MAVLQDLSNAAPEVVTAERARVATEGWGARLLALRDEDGQWAHGAYFPARGDRPEGDGPKGGGPEGGGAEGGGPEGGGADDAGGDTGWDRVPQPWTATTYSLLLLRDFGIDPRSEQMRQTIALVRDNCRWEEGGQPYFQGEVEPCINGMTVALGSYFDQDGVRAG